MPRGYTRLRVRDCGTGASDVWLALLRGFDRRSTGGRPRAVGTVKQVYDRSAYLAFDPEALGGTPLLGPPLVLLAGGSFDGPLATAVVGRGGAPFQADGLSAGAECRLRNVVGPGVDDRYVLAVGRTVELELDPPALSADRPDPGPYADVSAMTPESPTGRRARAALNRLVEEGVEDGLGWLGSVKRLAGGEEPTRALQRLIDGWSQVLDPATGTPETPPTDLLGRGPGATPSGDDVLSGLLLALARSTSGDRRERVSVAGERVVAAAENRTTTVSTALLAQAAQGRAAGRMEAALRVLLDLEGAPKDWVSAVLAAAEVGHTSGVDLLVGALLVPLGVGPRIARTG